MAKQKNAAFEPVADMPAQEKLNRLVAGFNSVNKNILKARELFNHIPMEERTALMVHYSKEPFRTNEISKRVARREISNLFLLQPHRRAPDMREFAFSVKGVPPEPDRKYILKMDSTTLVEARDAFTLFTQNEGYIGEADSESKEDS